MERLTVNKPVEEMGMYELAHNSCFEKNGEAWYRDFNGETSARDFARELYKIYSVCSLSEDDELLDYELMEDLMLSPQESVIGLTALFYRNLWAQADLYERLKYYENLEEQGLLQKLPCKIGADVYTIPSKVNFELNVLSGHKENNRIYHQKIANIIFTEKGWYMTGNLDMEYGTGRPFLDIFYKETWFLTKEAALKEMEK